MAFARLVLPPLPLVGAAALKVARCASSEPESEPETLSFHSHASAAQALRSASSNHRPPPANPEVLPPEVISAAVAHFLCSPEARQILDGAVERALRQGEFVAELQRSRAREEEGFRGSLRRISEEAAQAAARSEVSRLHALIKAFVEAATRRELEREVPRAVRDDVAMRQVLAAHLCEVREAVRQAAERELVEVADEERHQRVNRAFLESLERRCDRLTTKAQGDVDNAIRRSARALLLSQVVGVAALVLGVAGLARASRL